MKQTVSFGSKAGMNNLGIRTWSLFLLLTFIGKISVNAQQRIELGSSVRLFKVDTDSSEMSGGFMRVGAFGKNIKPYILLEDEPGYEFKRFVANRTTATVSLLASQVIPSAIFIYGGLTIR